MSAKSDNLLAQLDNMTPAQLRRLLVEQLTQKKLGLNWESNAIERDAALNANIVLPRLVPDYSCALDSPSAAANLVIEGDNFDSLRLLRATHRGKIRVIYKSSVTILWLITFNFFQFVTECTIQKRWAFFPRHTRR